jgi:hypothetical protein
MHGMRRTLGSVGAWLLATSLAVLVSWLGVQSVRFAAVPDRVSPMTAAEARKVVPASATPAPAPNATSDTPTPSATPTPTAGSSTTSSPSSGTPESPGSDLWTPVPDGRGGTALLRTVETEGGSARLRFSADEVTVLATTPNDGFTGTFNQQSATVVTVTFSSSGHTSRLTAFWDRVAKVQVSEEPTAA